MFSNKPVDI